MEKRVITEEMIIFHKLHRDGLSVLIRKRGNSYSSLKAEGRDKNQRATG